MTELATEAQIRQFCARFPEWEHSGQALKRIFVFKDFVAAFGFMSQVALVAERQGHHPDWSNVYKTVEVSLTTHEVSGLTEKDFELASYMASLVT